MSSIKCPAEPLHFAGVTITGIRKHIYSCRNLKHKEKETRVLQCQYCFLHFFLEMEQLENHWQECTSMTKHIPWDPKFNVIIIQPDPNLKDLPVAQPPKNWEYFRDKKLQKKREKLLALQEQENPVLRVRNVGLEPGELIGERESIEGKNQNKLNDNNENADKMVKTEEGSTESRILVKQQEENDQQTELDSILDDYPSTGTTGGSLLRKRTYENWNDSPQKIKKVKVNEDEKEEEAMKSEALRKQNEEKMVEQHKEFLRHKIKVDDYQNYVNY